MTKPTNAQRHERIEAMRSMGRRLANLKVSFKDVADKLGMSRSGVSNWFAGWARPSEEAAAKLEALVGALESGRAVDVGALSALAAPADVPGMIKQIRLLIGRAQGRTPETVRGGELASMKTTAAFLRVSMKALGWWASGEKVPAAKSMKILRSALRSAGQAGAMKRAPKPAKAAPRAPRPKREAELPFEQRVSNLNVMIEAILKCGSPGAARHAFERAFKALEEV